MSRYASEHRFIRYGRSKTGHRVLGVRRKNVPRTRFTDAAKAVPHVQLRLVSSPVSSSTVVSCAEKEESGRANLTVLRASSDIEIEILVPNENFVPLGVLRRAGNFVMQRIVDIGVPQVNQSPEQTVDCL